MTAQPRAAEIGAEAERRRQAPDDMLPMLLAQEGVNCSSPELYALALEAARIVGADVELEETAATVAAKLAALLADLEEPAPGNLAAIAEAVYRIETARLTAIDLWEGEALYGLTTAEKRSTAAKARSAEQRKRNQARRMTSGRVLAVRRWLEQLDWSDRAGKRDRAIAFDILALAEDGGRDIVRYSPQTAGRRVAGVTLRSARRAMPSLVDRGYLRKHLRGVASVDPSKRRATMYQIAVGR
jgi:hypothetical protein